MATATPVFIGQNPVRVSWTVDALEAAIERGKLNPLAKYEIVFGELYQKMGQNWPHRFAVEALDRAFRSLDESEFLVSAQMPLAIGDDQPEPDLQVVRGSLESRQSMPSADDALFVAEVSDTSYRFDRLTKAQLYASAGIPVYWIIDLGRRRVEVFSLPEDGAYLETRIFGAGEVLPAPFPGAPEVGVNRLLQPEASESDEVQSRAHEGLKTRFES